MNSKKLAKTIEYYRANPIEWLEDFFPDISFTETQKNILLNLCEKYRKIDNIDKAYESLRSRQTTTGLQYTLATMLYTSTTGGKGSGEVEVNGFKCNIQ